MLNKKEVAVMRAIYDSCKTNNFSTIITDERIIALSPEKLKLNNAAVDTILKQLEYDGYFECVKSDRRGTTVNVITLKQKGKAFCRELVQRRRDILSNMFWRIIYAATGAVVALAINKLLGR